MTKKQKSNSYYEKNRDKLVEYQRNWRKRSAEKIREYKSKVELPRLNGKIKSLKDKKGGKCQICGYNREIKILHFHHAYPYNKKFEIGNKRYKSIEELEKEANKCVLLCPNCHALLHLRINDEMRLAFINE